MLKLKLFFDFTMDERFKVLRQPFAEEPYSLSYIYFKICHVLAGLEDLTIEEDKTFGVVGGVRMEIYRLVMYICQRLRGGRAHACDYETVFERYRLKRLSLL